MKKPRLCKPWGYPTADPREVIKGYLLNDPELYSRRNRQGAIIGHHSLSSVIPTWGSNVYPEENAWGYWAGKTPENLTEEDKAFLRWVIRKGKLRDAPIKEKDY
jgi:hypothetical protein